MDARQSFLIRNATSCDADTINRLCLEAYAEFRTRVGEINWSRLRETLSRTSELSNAGELIVAEDPSGLLGVVLYVPPSGTKRAFVRTLAVDPQKRGRGIGRRLTQECIDRARTDGADSIGLTTADMMTVALPMYERMGFAKESNLGKRFGVPHARYVLKLSQ